MDGDIGLWRDLKMGDHQALETIYNRDIKFLYNYGRKLSNDLQFVEDCIHDLFVYLWNKRDSLSDTNNIKGYLATSLRRRMIDGIKKNRISDTDDALLNERDAELNFEDLLISSEKSSEEVAKIKKTLEQLSSRQQEIIYLKFFMELDYDAICKTMDIAISQREILTTVPY